MIADSRGDVVLVSFVFSDESGQSVVRGILRTIHRALILRRLGAMPLTDLQAIDQRLRESLAL